MNKCICKMEMIEWKILYTFVREWSLIMGGGGKWGK